MAISRSRVQTRISLRKEREVECAGTGGSGTVGESAGFWSELDIFCRYPLFITWASQSAPVELRTRAVSFLHVRDEIRKAEVRVARCSSPGVQGARFAGRHRLRPLLFAGRSPPEIENRKSRNDSGLRAQNERPQRCFPEASRARRSKLRVSPTPFWPDC